MEMFRFCLAALFILIGVFFSILSVLGVFRFKYILQRMHAAAMGDTLAIFFVLAGLIIISGFTITSLKLAVIIVFFWIAGPVSSHLISNLVVTVDKQHVDDICIMLDDEENSSENGEQKK